MVSTHVVRIVRVRRGAWRGLVSAIGLAVSLVVAGCGDPNEAINVGTALERARKTNQIVLVEFWGFNESCSKMDQTVLSDPLVRRDLEDFIRVRMNYSLSQDTARRIGVSGAPGFAALRADGSLIAAKTGYLDSDGYRQFLVRSKIFYR